MKREVMKKEAIKRMKMFGLIKNVIDEFEKNDVLNESEGYGILYWLNDSEIEMVKAFEERNGYLVYHVIHSVTNFGEMYTLLYVSTYKEEWEQDACDIKECCPLAYVINKNAPDCSEFGCVGVKPINGGLMRIY